MTAPAQEPDPGKPGSFSQLFVRNRDRVLQYARRLVGARQRGAAGEEPEECVQDASAEFLKKPRQYGSESHFVHLFLGFVRNAFRGRRRHDGAQKRGDGHGAGDLPTTSGLQPEADAAGPHTAAARAELHRLLLSRLDQLKPEYRTVIQLRLLHELPWEQVAARLGLDSADAARKKYDYALGHLRRLLPEQGR